MLTRAHALTHALNVDGHGEQASGFKSKGGAVCDGRGGDPVRNEREGELGGQRALHQGLSCLLSLVVAVAVVMAVAVVVAVVVGGDGW